MTVPNPAYPVQLDIERAERYSRLLIFVKWLLVIPLLIEGWVLAIVAYVVIVIGFFAILFTGRWPEGLFNFMVGFERWRARVSAYMFLQVDRYPPFGLDDDRSYPVRFEVQRPERIARWRPLVAWLLVIPAALGMLVVGLLAYLASIAAWFAILFTGRYPEGLFDAVTVGLRWSARVTMYLYWITEEYPPFVWA